MDESKVLNKIQMDNKEGQVILCWQLKSLGKAFPSIISVSPHKKQNLCEKNIDQKNNNICKKKIKNKNEFIRVLLLLGVRTCISN
jgi:hypothetical protein